MESQKLLQQNVNNEKSMKKVYSVIVLICLANIILFGQTKSPGYKVLDTYNGDIDSYLVENFLYRSEYYNQQPLSVLLNDLELPIEYHFSSSPENGSYYVGVYLDLGGTPDAFLYIGFYDVFSFNTEFRYIKSNPDREWNDEATNFFAWRKIKDISLSAERFELNQQFLGELGNPNSQYYNQQLYDEFIADKNSYWYCPTLLAECRCNILSSLYNEEECSKPCDLTSTKYNCFLCQHLAHNQNTSFFNNDYYIIDIMLESGNRTTAFEFFLYTLGYYEAIDHTTIYDPNYDGFIKIEGTASDTINFIIGKELSNTTMLSIDGLPSYEIIHYYGTLLREMNAAAEQGMLLYYGYYELYGKDVIDYWVMARSILLNESFVPYGSPFWIAKKYKESVEFYHSKLNGTELNVQSYFDDLESYISTIQYQLNLADIECY